MGLPLLRRPPRWHLRQLCKREFGHWPPAAAAVAREAKQADGELDDGVVLVVVVVADEEVGGRPVLAAPQRAAALAEHASMHPL